MELRELQQLFLDAIRYPTGIDDFLAQAEPSVRAAFDAAFVGTAALDRRQRMTIYAESYYWRLAEVLGDQYRVVAWLAGPRRFHNLVTDFVWQRPSHSPDVRRFGRELPELIAEHPIAAELEGIEQLARVERSIVEAIDAEDLPRLEEAALARSGAARGRPRAPRAGVAPRARGLSPLGPAGRGPSAASDARRRELRTDLLRRGRARAGRSRGPRAGRGLAARLAASRPGHRAALRTTRAPTRPRPRSGCATTPPARPR